ncbi:hypothetical protein EIP91_011000 [Steccherinum ochraceum]|uniref:F-box domain-containing protein n=1 Tax=Steccherinum ochraceum TaxID=92696 RepID=A0A4R0RMG4_9APHY|nr:hypothetical protein EIP91_011000 [Steccherinum ochraceum]
MHKAFEIGEIVDLIVAKLIEGNRALDVHAPKRRFGNYKDDCKPFRDIISLGSTASIFREPSLNAIWYRQRSLAPLFNSLGLLEDWRVRYEYYGTKGTLTLSRSLCAADAPMLLKYSSRIRMLEITGPTQLSFSEDQLWTLPGGPLFPHLQQVYCLDEDPKILAFIVRNMGDRLTHLSLSPARFTSRVLANSISDSLTHVSANLQCLEILEDGFSPDLHTYADQVLFTALRLACNARELSLHGALYYNRRAWNVILGFQTLKKLSIVLSYIGNPLRRTDTPAFSALTSLSITMDPQLIDSTTATLLPKAGLLCLRSSTWTIKTTDLVKNSQVCHLITAIADACSISSLNHLDVVFTTTYTPYSPLDNLERVLEAATLQPLLPYAKLRYLRLRLGHPWILEDSFLLEAARGWPDIETLELDPNPSAAKTTRITLQGLEYLALHCPRLQTLGLPVDFSQFDIPRHPAQGRPWFEGGGQTALRDLYLETPYVDSPSAVALSLSRMFPLLWKHAGSLQLSTTSSHHASRSMYQVYELLPVLALAREEGRIMASMSCVNSPSIVEITSSNNLTA